MGHVLAIDQGTTSSRAIVFDGTLRPVASGQLEFEQIFPRSGWVEHDPEAIWQSTLQSCRTALDKAGLKATDIDGIGITNQRETTIVWDRQTGQPLGNAIVWQDRRTDAICTELRQAGHEDLFRTRTGLLLDPFFSGTKLKWILDQNPGARERAEKGELLFGTIDSYLIWRLTGGKRHVTDATNASRTLLYDIRNNRWDEEICGLLGVPTAMLPQVLDCADDFGTTDPELLLGEIPILGVAGDQQAALIGQGCFTPGMVKSTYGTGAFALMNTGETLIESQHKLLGTIAYRLDGKTIYALEGSIFVAGAVVQWLRDGLGIIARAADTEDLAAKADPHQSLYLVPAFTGLGAPYWDPDARGAIFGLTRNSGPAEFAGAALQSIGYQSRDLIEAMQADAPDASGSHVMRVDGGLSANAYAMQFLADMIGQPVERPPVLETTALGAAWLAGMRAGLYPEAAEFAKDWKAEARFDPQMDEDERQARYAGWQDAVRRTLSAD